MELLDKTALYKIGYGLYAITTNDGKKDNAFICNTVVQVADNPLKITVAINKQNYSHETIKQTGKMNVNVLSIDCPFSLFEQYGFKSGRDTNKLEGDYQKTTNGLVVLPNYVNAVISLTVDSYVDLASHGLFICSVTESKVLTQKETLTYAFYHSNVKPKPQATYVKGYSCTICGYFHEGETLPADFVCPWCKHPASDFEPVK